MRWGGQPPTSSLHTLSRWQGAPPPTIKGPSVWAGAPGAAHASCPAWLRGRGRGEVVASGKECPVVILAGEGAVDWGIGRALHNCKRFWLPSLGARCTPTPSGLECPRTGTGWLWRPRPHSWVALPRGETKAVEGGGAVLGSHLAVLRLCAPGRGTQIRFSELHSYTRTLSYTREHAHLHTPLYIQKHIYVCEVGTRAIVQQ